MHGRLELMEMLHFPHLSLLKFFVKHLVSLLSSMKPSADSHTPALLVHHHVSTAADLLNLMVSLARPDSEENQLVEAWSDMFRLLGQCDFDKVSICVHRWFTGIESQPPAPFWSP
jgi:hypothetical protein